MTGLALRDVPVPECDVPDAAALKRLQEEAAATEVPADAVCARLASTFARAGCAERAARWSVRTVDGGTDVTAWRTACRVLDEVCPGGTPDQRRHLRVGVLSTATVTPLVPCLRLALARCGIGAELYEAPFGQYWQDPLDPASGLTAFEPDVVVLVPDHHALGDDGEPATDARWLETEVRRWTSPWAAIRSRSSAQVVQVSFVEPEHDTFGVSAAMVPGSRRARLRALDGAIAAAAAERGVAHVDAESIAAAIGKRRWFSPRYWHAAKHAFSIGVAPELALQVAATIAARLGLSKKVLVLDLDNTLWHGVIGDDGLAGIALSGPKGEAHVDFQRAIRELGRRGVVLAACSKNDAATARLPFEHHPDMVLAVDDFAAFVANWESKPANVRDIARRLSLPLDSFVFVDDNPVEREAIRQALPMVDVLALSADPAEWRADLGRYPWLEPGAVTAEDRGRGDSYRARAAAAELEAGAESLEQLHASLQMRATLAPVDDVSFDRVLQLIGKTNQFNVTTRRHSAAALRRIVEDPTWVHVTARLEDRFADHGLVAVALSRRTGDVLDVDTLLMSCRVIGRALESILVEELVTVARSQGLRAVRAHYVPSERNGLVADLWTQHGFREAGTVGPGATYELVVEDHVPRSTHIAVRRNS